MWPVVFPNPGEQQDLGDHHFEFSDQFKLTAIANDHLKSYAEYVADLRLPNEMQAHSFLIEAAGRKIFYSADIESLDDIKSRADGCDYVITELTHVDLDAFFLWARTASVGQFIITHLGSDSEIAQLRTQLSDADLSNVALAEDGLRLEL